MKTVWAKMCFDMEQQKKLTSSLIVKVTHNRYKTAINQIWVPEMLGSAVCLVCFFYVAVNFTMLNNWYLIACGIIAMAILLVMPVLSIKAVKQLNAINIAKGNNKQLLEQYAAAKMQFLQAQRLSFYLGPLLMVSILPVMVMQIGGVDFFKTTNAWLVYVVFCPIFYPYAKWVFKRYKKSVEQSEDIIRDLEEQ